jgi:cell division protein FtsW (lipid II flippase)
MNPKLSEKGGPEMWKGRVLELIGLWLMVTALMHHSPDSTAWINIFTGGVVAIFGASLLHSKAWQGLTAVVAGAFLFFLAFVPSFRAHNINLWVDSVVGIVVWFCGWRIVASEIGGPWRLKDGPVY